MVQELLAYSKRFGGSGIGFVRKYRFDPFFRTELNVIVLQCLFSLLILAFVAAGYWFLYNNLSSELISGIAENIGKSATTSSVLIADDLESARLNNLLLVLAGITALALVFGYLIARLALLPARNALGAQKQFIGNIAHELRTPLSIIKTNTEVRLLDADVTPEARELHEDNLEELDRISNIINNLLSLNVLVSPERIPFENVALDRVADRALGHLAPLIERKRLAVETSHAAYATVWGNAVALEQVAMNVIRNAAVYTPEGGSIEVATAPDYRGHIVLTVKDSGMGISEKDLPRIFEPFYRADQSRARHGAGSGLGLAIVNELVRLHRGQITIRSTRGKGTSVLISIPCGHDGKENPSAEAEEVVVDYSSPGTANGEA